MEPRNLETLKLFERASAIAGDHDSGAAELLALLLPLLSDAVRVGGSAPLEVARTVLAGQPAMAPLWHACAAAVIEGDQRGTFERTRAEMERAPRALIRAASLALRDLIAGEDSPLVLTLSYSSSVSHVLLELASSTSLRVVCAEGRPGYEGRRLAATLAPALAEVTVVVDAALTAMLADASAVVMGADAVAADYWINKVGSFGIAASASLHGVPVYVIAARDKFVPSALAPRLATPAASPDEVWPDRPANVLVSNVYFERIPSHLATLVLTDAGAIAPTDSGSAAQRHSRNVSYLLDRLP